MLQDQALECADEGGRFRLAEALLGKFGIIIFHAICLGRGAETAKKGFNHDELARIVKERSVNTGRASLLAPGGSRTTRGRTLSLRCAPGCFTVYIDLGERRLAATDFNSVF
jgi:hypothetical protein